MAKLIKKEGRLFIELPESLKGKKIKAVKLEPEIFVIASEDAIKKLIERQMHYTISRRIKTRLVENDTSKKSQWKKEYAILPSEDVARTFSREHAWEFKRGDLLGVKGFDGKYYVIRAATYAEILEVLQSALGKEGATPKEAAERLNRPEDLLKVVLEIAKEEGIVYEMKGGKYRYAG